MIVIIIAREGGMIGPRRAQISQCELFELIPLLKLNKQFPVEQFEATVSQSTVPSPFLIVRRRACVWVHNYVIFPYQARVLQVYNSSAVRRTHIQSHTRAIPSDAGIRERSRSCRDPCI